MNRAMCQPRRTPADVGVFVDLGAARSRQRGGAGRRAREVVGRFVAARAALGARPAYCRKAGLRRRFGPRWVPSGESPAGALALLNRTPCQLPAGHVYGLGQCGRALMRLMASSWPPR